MQLLASGSRSSEAIQRCHNLMQDSYKKLVGGSTSSPVPYKLFFNEQFIIRNHSLVWLSAFS